MDDKHLRRAGLDYHEYAEIKRHASWRDFLDSEQPAPRHLFALTTRASRGVYDVSFAPGDWLVFGSETRGLSEYGTSVVRARTVPETAHAGRSAQPEFIQRRRCHGI